MARIRLGMSTLSRWFPPNDPLAVSMARLCILREDFALEVRGIPPDEIPGLDARPDLRRVYFFRNSIRTLMELFSVINRLQSDRNFQEIMATQPEPRQRAHKLLVRKIHAAHEIVKTYRNSIGGGHVQERAVRATLDGLGDHTIGFFEAGEGVGQARFQHQFAGELTGEIMEAAARLENRTLEDDIRELSRFVSIINAIDEIFAIYLESRDLSP